MNKWCGYSQKAIELLKQKNIKPIIIDIEKNENQDLRNALYKYLTIYKKITRKTVPQIFFGKKYIGGFDDLSTYFRKF